MLSQMSINYSGFYEIWNILNEVIDPTSVDIYTIPWVVNGAFACEIGMKYILTQNQIAFKRKHLLHELYNLLPDKHKAEITKDLYEKCLNYSSEQINQEILLLSDSFCNFRYSHEMMLTLNMNFFKIWCTAIFKQVNTYPSYVLVKRTGEFDITVDEFDRKMLEAQNEMLSKLKKKERN